MIPTQTECDPNNPEEHVLWALKNLPSVQGVGQIVHPSILKQWSRHLVECGFVHVDSIKALANKNGTVSVKKLPEQKIEWRPPLRGSAHEFNRGEWVPVGTPQPKPIRLPDVRQMSPEENQIMLDQYRRAGFVPDLPPVLDVAEELLLP